MPKKNQHKVENLSRLLVYILGHRPDEFGLVPDPQGFIAFKELLWALHEEPGWGYVRQGHINEVLLGKDRTLFQTEDNRIRTMDRRWHLDMEMPSPSIPTILFIAVRRRAHAHVFEKGLRSTQTGLITLTPDRDMALRIGRRRDQNPVILEVSARSAEEKGLFFCAFGDLYLARDVPPKFIQGPPLPKEPVKSLARPKTEPAEKQVALGAGTFLLDPNRDPDLSRRAKGKKRKSWKEEARKQRKRKR